MNLIPKKKHNYVPTLTPKGRYKDFAEWLNAQPREHREPFQVVPLATYTDDGGFVGVDYGRPVCDPMGKEETAPVEGPVYMSSIGIPIRMGGEGIFSDVRFSALLQRWILFESKSSVRKRNGQSACPYCGKRFISVTSHVKTSRQCKNARDGRISLGMAQSHIR